MPRLHTLLSALPLRTQHAPPDHRSASCPCHPPLVLSTARAERKKKTRSRRLFATMAPLRPVAVAVVALACLGLVAVQRASSVSTAAHPAHRRVAAPLPLHFRSAASAPTAALQPDGSVRQATELVQYEQVLPEQEVQYAAEKSTPGSWQQLRPISSAQAQQLAEPSNAFSLGGSLNLPPPAPVPIKNLQIKALPPPAPQPPTVVRFTGPISVQRPSPCPSCCLKCPGGVCTKACNKMLLKEVFKKMYDSNKARIKKLEFFMKENKKRIERSEGRIAKYVPTLLPPALARARTHTHTHTHRVLG